ncbi:hypothetical protein [Actinomadura macrotermitis]|uniref:Uncharacterized protein n=1 Tax=Actinomadura macrotermitis TaxID=2585200 RepID=A0A7K0BRP5_9ACTN|nr:hypothetical protein [Actinomadura macrotermitis]MQY03875.1 hypothetical protein [Actinomadura macrotermitis]
MRQRAERGEGAVSYIAVVLLIAAISAAVVTSSLGSQIVGFVDASVCKVFDQRCGSRPVAGNAGPSPSLLPTGPLTQPPLPTQVPRPSPGPPPPVPPPPKPKPPNPDQVETENALNETQIGRDALKWVHDNGIKVVYRKGGGSYWSDEDKVFYVDTNQSPENRANTFVHEVNHAKHRNEPDPKKMKKEEYVDKALDEETQGTVDAILNNQQLQQERGNGTPPATLLQNEYETASRNAINAENAARAKAQRPPLSPEEERKIGADAGRQRVKQAFQNGEVVSSVDGHTYPQNYGDSWDDANSCFLWIFC